MDQTKESYIQNSRQGFGDDCQPQELVHDGIGVWLAARRLNSGKFVWPREGTLTTELGGFNGSTGDPVVDRRL